MKLKSEDILIGFGFINTCITLGRFYLYAFTGKDFFSPTISFDGKAGLTIVMFCLSTIPILIGLSIKHKW